MTGYCKYKEKEVFKQLAKEYTRLMNCPELHKGMELALKPSKN